MILAKQKHQDKERRIKELMSEIATRFGYKILRLDVYQVKNDLDLAISEIISDQNRYLSIDFHLTEDVTVEKAIADFGPKFARQYFFDNSESRKYIELESTLPSLLDRFFRWSYKKDFERIVCKDIIERSKRLSD